MRPEISSPLQGCGCNACTRARIDRQLRAAALTLPKTPTFTSSTSTPKGDPSMTDTLLPGDAITRGNAAQLREGDVVELRTPADSLRQETFRGPITRGVSGFRDDWNVDGSGRHVKYRLGLGWTAKLLSRAELVKAEEAKKPGTLEMWEAELLTPADAQKAGALVELKKGDDVVRGRVRVTSLGESRVGENTGATVVAMVRKGYSVRVIEKAPVALPELPTALGFYRPAHWTDNAQPALAYQLSPQGWRTVFSIGSPEKRTAEQVQKEAGEKGLVKLVPAGSEKAKAPELKTVSGLGSILSAPILPAPKSPSYYGSLFGF